MSSSSRKMLQAAAGAGGGAFYPYTVDYSCRFNDGDSPKLTRTNGSSATSNQKFTYSVWFKRCTNGLQQSLFYAGNSGGNNNLFAPQMWTDDRFRVVFDGLGSYTVYTPGKLRDNSAWYHIVVAVDTTQATSTNRCKIYINGEQQTVTGTQPPQNHAINAGASDVMAFSDYFSSRFIDGYKAQDVYIDGTQLDATSFGETKNGVWIPKNVSGLTFGTLGAYLDFADSANLGNDVSGNNNDFTSSGLSSSDQMIDTPTSNFCTMNPLDPEGASNTLSEGNLGVYINSQNTSEEGGATFAFDSGKWYWETYLLSTNSSNLSNVYVGIKDPNGSDYWMVRGNGGEAEHNGTQTTVSGLSWGTVGDIIGVAVDADAGTWTVSVNGTWISGNVHTSLSGLLTPFNANGNSANQHNIRVNFGQDSTFAGNTTAGGNTDANGNGDFKYTVPTDHLALCTANLPEPTIGPNSATQSDENFNTVLYTGNGSTQSVTGVGFQPDFTWIKKRSGAERHVLFDAVRGAGYQMSSDLVNAQAYLNYTLTSFDSDGFSNGNNGYTNESGYTYVAWNWKGNGAGVSNTDGTTASTVSANTDAGISIITYSGGSTANQTIGHGLGVKPKVVIVKTLNDTYSWIVFSEDILGLNNALKLNTTGALDTSWSGYKLSDTSSVIRYGTYYQATAYSGLNYITYAFAEVEGFSKFGKYTGNGSSDGAFVYTGFRPAWVMIKATDIAYSWNIYDSGRSEYNTNDYLLLANTSDAEIVLSGMIDFLSNGFKLRSSALARNGNGNNYIYMAFAENPFKYSTAR